MQKNKRLKGIISVVLCVIMVITSIPFALAAPMAGIHDPIPVFDKEIVDKKGVSAWWNDDGGISVYFPSATSKKSFLGADKTVTNYVLEIVDLGVYAQLHTENVIFTKKVTPAAGDMQYHEITADELATIMTVNPTTTINENRFNVTITAVDSENWFSESLHAFVSDVPTFVPRPTEIIRDTPKGIREMLLFEGQGLYGQSANGRTDKWANNKAGDVSINNDEWVDAGLPYGVSLIGKATDAGAMIGADRESTAYGLRFDEKVTNFSFDAIWSRDMGNFSGADEACFWVDTTDVELNGLSFRFRANEQAWYGWDDCTKAQSTGNQAYEGILYSTIGTTMPGYKGAVPYADLMKDNGEIERVYMTDDGTPTGKITGKINVKDFVGYIRIPVGFFCSETDSFVNVRNDKWDIPNDTSLRGLTDQAGRNKINPFFKKEFLYSQTTYVDPAGTSIDKALLLQRRGMMYKTSAWPYTGPYYFEAHETGVYGNDYDNYRMLAYGLTAFDDRATPDPGTVTSDEATHLNGVYKVASVNTDANGNVIVDGNNYASISNRENAWKAIDDIYSAGFAFDSISDDSVHQNIFIDNIIFYKDYNPEVDPDGGFPDVPIKKADGTVYGTSSGQPVSNYYNQALNIVHYILQEADKRISSDSWGEYKGVIYIDQMIQFYRDEYAKYGANADFLSNENIAATASSLGLSHVWERYNAAKDECRTKGTLNKDGSFKSNDGPDDLVPIFEQDMEKYPDPKDITAVSDDLKNKIMPLIELFFDLNLGQLRSLGEETEEKVIEYMKLLDQSRSEIAVGDMLADFPFVPFCDFENNEDEYEVGQKIWQLEEDLNCEKNSLIDYRRTKGINLSAPIWTDLNNDDKTIGYPITRDNTLFDSSEAFLTNNGYMNSRAVTTTLDRAIQSKNDGWHVVTVSKDGKDAPIVDGKGRLEDNSMAQVNLGQLGGSYIDGCDVPLSLVFYVDFTGMKDFKFKVNVFTKYNDGTDVKAITFTGALAAAQKYFALNTETGEWESITGGNAHVFLSNANAGDKINLAGYRGYIMIPLYHLKYDVAVPENDYSLSKKLDENPELVNNIYAVQFGVEDINGTNDRQSFVIDNIGFTYDPVAYANAGRTAGRTDLSYADIYKAKSTVAQTWIDEVSKIDMYGPLDNFLLAVANAQTNYKALPAAQQKHPEVLKVKAKLDEYQKYAEGKEPIPEEVYGLDDLKTKIAELGTGLLTQDGNISGSNDLLNDAMINSDGTVNYGYYGLQDKANAEEIVKLYTDSYKRYSVEQKNLLGDYKNKLINAFNAASRCLELEKLLAQAGTVDGHLASAYKATQNREFTENGKDQSMISLVGRNDIVNIYNEYNKLNYYAKQMIKNGDTDPADSSWSFKNMPSALQRVLKNSKTYVFNDTTVAPVDGGLIARQKEYEELYARVQDIMLNKKLFTAENGLTLEYLKNVVDEYDSYIPAYHNINELYNKIWDIIDQFPAYNMGFDKTGNVTETTLTLDGAKTLTGSVDFLVSYLEEFPDKKTGELSDSYFKVTRAGGEITNAGIKYKVAFGGTELTAPTEETPRPITTVKASALGMKNNTYTEAAPFTAKIDVTFEEKVVSGKLTDTILIEHYRPALSNFGETEEQKLGTYKLLVTYSMGDTYTVTIPASIDVPFNSTAEVTKNVNVTHNMVVTKQITVGLAAGNDYKMTLDTTGLTNVPDPLPELPYIANFGTDKSIVYAGAGASKTETAEPLKIKVPDWSKAYVNNYKDGTLTFVVSYGDKPTT